MYTHKGHVCLIIIVAPGQVYVGMVVLHCSIEFIGHAFWSEWVWHHPGMVCVTYSFTGGFIKQFKVRGDDFSHVDKGSCWEICIYICMYNSCCSRAAYVFFYDDKHHITKHLLHCILYVTHCSHHCSEQHCSVCKHHWCRCMLADLVHHGSDIWLCAIHGQCCGLSCTPCQDHVTKAVAYDGGHKPPWSPRMYYIILLRIYQYYYIYSSGINILMYIHATPGNFGAGICYWACLWMCLSAKLDTVADNLCCSEHPRFQVSVFHVTAWDCMIHGSHIYQTVLTQYCTIFVLSSACAMTISHSLQAWWNSEATALQLCYSQALA